MTVVVDRGIALDTTSGRMNLVVSVTVAIAVDPADTQSIRAAVAAATTDDGRTDAVGDAVDARLTDLVSRAIGDRVRVLDVERRSWTGNDHQAAPPEA